MSGYQSQGYDPRQQQPQQQWGQQPDYPASFQPDQQRAQVQPYAPSQYQQPYPQQYPPPGWQPPMQVAPRSPAVGLIVSFFLPGVGSMMAGKTRKGIGILVGYMVGWLLCLVLIGFIVMPIFWIWGMVAAYRDAVAWNREHGIIS
jgi:TM2 domain-containing membrane protein YozV